LNLMEYDGKFLQSLQKNPSQVKGGKKEASEA
jgi:hypothetical protein